MESIFEKAYKFCPTCKTELVRAEIDRRQLLNCKNCGFIFWNNPKPVTSVIVHKEGKVLLLKSQKEPYLDFWVLPGGFIDYEEEPREAVSREVKEEAGLDLEIEEILDAYRITDDPRGVNIDIVFVGTVDGEPQIEKETFSEYRFFSPEELPERIAYNHRGMIEKWSKKT